MELQTTAPETERPQRLLDGYMTLVQIAQELPSRDGGNPGERMTRMLMDSLQVPYVKVGGVRLYERGRVKAAILSRETNKEARRPGRPRKQAA